MKKNGNRSTFKNEKSKNRNGYKNQKTNLCMKGNIYPTKTGFIVRFGRNISKWFKYRPDAERFLNHLRYETDNGTFDNRDYQSDKPLSFSKLADKWLEKKRNRIKPKSFNNLKNYMNKAKKEWKDTNIKKIGYAEIEDFFDSQVDLSAKTKSNMKSCLHDFWNWLLQRKVITRDQLPEFPQTPFELGWRNIIAIETQQQIIHKVKELSYSINPKIWLGLRWLSIYGIRMRPGEMLNLKEEDIQRKIGDFGALIIPHPKEKKPKIIFLLEEDYRILKQIPRGLPDLYFFRHEKGIKGCKGGQKFGEKYLYKWWKKACAELGIHDVDLYGGTRHSTVTAAGEHFTPEQIKQATGHATNKAFERYFQKDARGAENVFQTIIKLQHNYNIHADQKSS
ncbi:MAG: hypothetical protein JRI76_12595 [Deltaproteobacteria bacterium]|nr:hypothetical protein [Deltaproteobacteria bacterium]